jgi:trehalose-phosphatase
VPNQQKSQDFTKHNTLGLTMESYTEKAGAAQTPKIVVEKPEWQPALAAFLHRDIAGGTMALFLDFDGTMACFTATPEETLAVHGFLSALSTLLAKGYQVAIITGRPIAGEKGLLAALTRSGASEELVNRLAICGSHGVQYRGGETNWEVRVPAALATQIAPYAQLQQKLLDHLQQCIAANDALKGLGISFEPKPLGATIHYRAVESSRHAQAKHELDELLAKMMPQTADNTNFIYMDDETYKNFTYNPATESFEIRLNPAVTGIEVHKGTSVKSLAEKWEATVAIAFGDDTTDLDMQTQLRELVNAKKLQFQAFVGVKHSRSPKQIMTDSTLVVDGQESAVGLLVQMAWEAEEQLS